MGSGVTDSIMKITRFKENQIYYTWDRVFKSFDENRVVIYQSLLNEHSYCCERMDVWLVLYDGDGEYLGGFSIDMDDTIIFNGLQ